MDSAAPDAVDSISANNGSKVNIYKDGNAEKIEDYDLRDYVKTDVSKLIPCFAFCCFVNSCFLENNCWRCTIAQEACCCTTNLIICMPYLCIKSASAETKCCLIAEGICGIHKPETCVKAEYQVMCCDVRLAFPMEPTFQPCLLSILGWTCFLDYDFIACTEVMIEDKESIMCCLPVEVMKEKLAEKKQKQTNL